jgi:hypothetical protein
LIHLRARMRQKAVVNRLLPALEWVPNSIRLRAVLGLAMTFPFLIRPRLRLPGRVDKARRQLWSGEKMEMAIGGKHVTQTDAFPLLGLGD